MKKKNWEILLFAYLIFFTALCLLIGIFTRFHASLNDFLWNLRMTRRIDVHDASSFYNGFFPLGYAVFLKLISFRHPFVFAYLANILFGLALLGSIAYLTTKTVGPGWALACIIALSLTPKVFDYVTIPGPDMGTTAFIAVGATLLIIAAIKELKRSHANVLVFVGGVLFGLSALWRYNGLPLGVGFIVASALVWRKYRTYLVFGFAGLFLTYSIQFSINLASGHGLMETATNFNVYITMYGVSFEKVSSMVNTIPHSPLHIILSAPGTFLRAYHKNFVKIIPTLIPLLLGTIILKDEKQVKISAILFLASTFYFAVVTIGSGQSHRADLPVIPFSIYQTIVLASFAYGVALQLYSRQRLNIVVSSAIILAAAWIIVSWGKEDFNLIKDRKHLQSTFHSIQAVLIQDGVTSSTQVFSTNYDLYFPAMEPYQPYNNGDWPRYSMYKFNEEYPELSTRDMDAFLSDCRRHAITHIVLDESAEVLSPELGKIFSGEREMKQFHEMGQFGELKVFKIESF